MSDRLAVFNRGRIEQVGAPAEVYERPATTFVAGFVGTSNLLEGRGGADDPRRGRPFTVRPEKIRLADADEALDADERQRPWSGGGSRVHRPGHAVYRCSRRRQSSWS